MNVAKNELLGHLASCGAYTIFGINIICCKDISNAQVMSPYVLFMLRALGAMVLFWLWDLFGAREKVSGKDLLRMMLASFLGLFLPQVTFLVAVTMTTSIDTSIVTSLSPIMTMIIAAIFLGEPITMKKAGGVLLSFFGIMLLIFNSIAASGGASETKPLGIVLMLINGLSFASYLGAFRPLIARYHVVTLMKWMFLFSFIMILPFSWNDMFQVKFSAISIKLYADIFFVIIFSTFIAYFLIPIGQKHIRPTLVSMYSYLQPLLAVAISICIGMDVITWQKLLAACLIFGGVFIVNKSRAAIAK